MIAVHCTLTHAPLTVLSGDKVLQGTIGGTYRWHPLHGVWLVEQFLCFFHNCLHQALGQFLDREKWTQNFHACFIRVNVYRPRTNVQRTRIGSIHVALDIFPALVRTYVDKKRHVASYFKRRLRTSLALVFHQYLHGLPHQQKPSINKSQKFLETALFLVFTKW